MSDQPVYQGAARDSAGHWRPGTSGNPRGRPRIRGLGDELDAALDKPGDAAGTPRRAMIAERLAQDAANGDARAIATVLTFTTSRPAQGLELSTTEPTEDSMLHRFMVEHPAERARYLAWYKQTEDGDVEQG